MTGIFIHFKGSKIKWIGQWTSYLDFWHTKPIIYIKLVPRLELGKRCASEGSHHHHSSNTLLPRAYCKTNPRVSQGKKNKKKIHHWQIIHFISNQQSIIFYYWRQTEVWDMQKQAATKGSWSKGLAGGNTFGVHGF